MSADGSHLTLVESALLTPLDLGSFAIYKQVAKRAGLNSRNRTGYGLLLCRDRHEQRWTLITEDVEYVRALRAAAASGVLAGMEIPKEKFPLKRSGWPDDWI